MQLNVLLINLDESTATQIGESPIGDGVSLEVLNDKEQILCRIADGTVDFILLDATGTAVDPHSLLDGIIDADRQAPILLIDDRMGAKRITAGSAIAVEHIDKNSGIDSIVAAVGRMARRLSLDSDLVLSDNRFKAIFNHSPMASYCWQWDGEDLVLTDVNAAAEKFTGAEVFRNIGRRLSEFNQPDQRVVDALYRCRETGESLSLELEDYTSWPKGEKKAVELHLSACPPDLVLVQVQDISVRVKAQEQFRTNERMLARSQAVANLGSYVFDNVTQIWTSTEVLDRIFGINDQNERTVESWLEIVHPEDREMIYQHLSDHVIAKGSSFDREYRIVRANDGEVRWVHGLGELDFDEEGRVLKMHGTIQDITEQKRALQALQNSEKRFFDLFQEMSSGFALHEMIYNDAGRPSDYRFLEINPAFERLTGLDATELIGNTVRQKLPETENSWIKKYAAVAETGKPVTFEDYSAALDKHFEVTAYRPSPNRFAVVFTDITSRRKAEINLEWELKLNETMVDLSRQLLVPGKGFFNIACDVLQQARELTGAEHGFVSSIDPASRNLVCHTLTNMMGGECEMDWTDNQITFPIGPDGKYPSLWGVCLNTGEAFFTNTPAKHEAARGLPDKHVKLDNYLAAPAIIGDEVAGMVALSNLPGGFSDKHLEAVSRIAGLYALALEFERHLNALEEKENELRQTQKLEAIGNLAGGIAHDFNNVLYAIMGNAELAQSVMSDAEPAWKNVAEILKASKRAAELVKQILTFARRTSREREVIGVGPVIDEVIRMSRSTMPATVDISTAIDELDARVYADPTELHQVLLNLCTNAYHAVQDEGGKILVESAVVAAEDPGLVACNLQGNGEFVRIRVSDDGMGMPQEIRQQIFEPFFTTKKTGHGTGMGLAVVHGIVKDLGGEVIVDSIEGDGTTFSIYLPRATGDAQRSTEESDEALAGAERILLVDDEEELTTMLNVLLTKRGYQVDWHNSSTRALEEFKKDPDRYDLVVLDHTMPGMTGGELAQIMLAIRPDLPIVICTGYSHSMSIGKAREIGVREFMLKPISIKTLTKTIRQLLDNPDGKSEAAGRN